MKNHYYENIKRQFKKASHRKYHFENKVYCDHSFNETGPSDLTWWADFGFMLNDCYMNVDWIHPRTEFKDTLREKAFQVKHLYKEKYYENLMDKSEPIYKKLGKSRKKTLAWRTTLRNLNTDGFELALKLAEDNLQKEADFIIKPSISVEWHKYGKSVSMCAPVEIRSVNDVADLAQIIKRILKHEISVDEAFNHHRYTRLNWLDEFEIRGKPVRYGWFDASKKIAAAGDDVLV